MGSRRYYHHVEKDPENVKSIWKVLHTITFALIIFNSLVSAYIFGNILSTFNYRCILHVEPTFGLTEITYTNKTIIQDDVTSFKKENIKMGITDMTTETDVTDEVVTTIQPEINTTLQARPMDIDSLHERDTGKLNSSKVATNSSSLQNVFLIHNTFWYKNESLNGKVDLRIKGSDYRSTTSCDLVLFVPLISLIASATFGALILLFGRGQQSQRSWVFVYPVLITAAILTILSIIAMVSVKNGIEYFCSRFQEYTGNSRCSRRMSYFTFQDQWIISNFWDSYNICYYSYMISILLWTFQLVVTILRLTNMADFHFVAVSVENPEFDDKEEFEERIHNALIRSGMKPIKESMPNEEENKTNQNCESTIV